MAPRNGPVEIEACFQNQFVPEHDDDQVKDHMAL